MLYSKMHKSIILIQNGRSSILWKFIVSKQRKHICKLRVNKTCIYEMHMIFFNEIVCSKIKSFVSICYFSCFSDNLSLIFLFIVSVLVCVDLFEYYMWCKKIANWYAFRCIVRNMGTETSLLLRSLGPQ